MTIERSRRNRTGLIIEGIVGEGEQILDGFHLVFYQNKIRFIFFHGGTFLFPGRI